MIQNEKQPNVYIEDPTLINKEAILNPPSDPKARLKSARKMTARRPGSGIGAIKRWNIISPFIINIYIYWIYETEFIL